MPSPPLLDRVKHAVPFGRRRQAKLALVKARSVAGDAFSLPSFLILGAMRAGTSSLFKYLAQHPALYRSQRKEVEFFTNEFHRGERWYRAHFAPRWDRRRSFEACPSYLFHPLAPRRARALIPAAKLVVLVREPAARAYSHWQHMTRLGFERLPFAEAIAAESARTHEEGALVAAGTIHRSKAWERYSYVARGFYGQQLARWLDEYPATRCRVIRFDALVADPQRVLDTLCDFLGVERFTPRDLRNFSAIGRSTGYHRPVNKSPEDARALEGLGDIYVEDQRLLARLLDRVGRAAPDAH